ncbi:ABC transporter ATP-binding protein [Flavobacterium aurantiibacter]|uniref:ABC transporter ATP-binding protein n=1 Tax=Flavobacterium aurantiibacter TaxID=2023067 RepID=A0A256A0V6_9FLAO|nr:ABC transporter ATP-binding protein [Flavobacterium aurantiibacter]OYQ47427.1 ABC transporter ATP-binding protein [Flavobacterium aurantiibacter]
MIASEVILKVENLSKQYRLGEVGTGTLSHDLNRWWHRVRGLPDPYLKVGEANDRSAKGNSAYVWALKDINFEVQRGEVVGIIGKNGAGKSTLLKILSKVTAPTAGTVKYTGRIASLLEVGTGFHPELTGRENIFLNGAILGMTKKEIASKLNDIISFSGCERYIDTPVKRYSSGMTVRLAFAVAAFLEPDILIVDEVLAVGDAEFQKKALGKMQDISRGEGRTVLFVSHNLTAVQTLCSRSFLLKNGELIYSGATADVISKYLSADAEQLGSINLQDRLASLNDETVSINQILVQVSEQGNLAFDTIEQVEILFDVTVKQACSGLRIGFDLLEEKSATVLFRGFHDDDATELSYFPEGNYRFSARIPEKLLAPGAYKIQPAIGIHNNRWVLHDADVAIPIEIININGLNRAYADTRPGSIMPRLLWNSIRSNFNS